MGHSRTIDSAYEHAYWWSGREGETPIDLMPAEAYSSANALNEGDLVVGEYGLSFITPFRWSLSSGVETLTHPGVQGWARDINNDGVTVGYYQISGTVDYRACYWTADSTAAVDLNSHLPPGSGWVLEYAYGINDSGVIVGGGSLNGDDHAFAIAPFPLVMPKLLVDWNALDACRVHWPETSGVVLFESDDLGSWTVSAHTPEVVEGEASVVLDSDAAPVFFKLTTGATPPPDEPH